MPNEFKDLSPVDVLKMDALTFSCYMRQLDRELGRQDYARTTELIGAINEELRLIQKRDPTFFEKLREIVDVKGGNYINVHKSLKYREITITTELGISIDQNLMRAITKGESLSISGKFDAVSIKFEIPFGFFRSGK